MMELLKDSGPTPLDQINQIESSLCTLLNEKSPEWFVGMVDEITNYWRLHEKDSLWRFAPSRVSNDEISEIVAEAPYLALANFRNKLRRDQLTDCMSRSPEGAIRYAFEEMDDDSIIFAINEHPDHLLEYAANKMTEEHFECCVSMSLCSAFKWRNRMTPNRRAIVLSQGTQFGGAFIGSEEKEAIHAEIYDSLINHLDIWVRTYDNKFGNMIDTLKRNGIIDLHEKHTEFSKSLPEDQKAVFFQCISSSI